MLIFTPRVALESAFSCGAAEDSVERLVGLVAVEPRALQVYDTDRVTV